MILHNILSARYSEPEPSTAMVLSVDVTLDGVREVFDFYYSPDDVYGLSNDINAWFIDNPDFTIDPYVAPEEPEPIDPLTLPITKRQAVLAMVIAGGFVDVDEAIETAVGVITDPMEKGLAIADWRYAPQFWRNHPMFNNTDIMTALNLTSTDIDNLWLFALTQPA